MRLLPITVPAEPKPVPLQLRIQIGKKNTRQNHSQPDSKEQGNISDPLLCKACTAPITSRQQAVSIKGHHEHAFFNPAGIAFEIRCFQQAVGCLVQAEPCTEFSWFSGYCWQYAICSNCLTHLGWFFTGKGKDAFFALIGNRII
jgi:hypothetical protein